MTRCANQPPEPSFTSDERDRLATEVEKLQAGLRTLKTFNIQKPSLSGPPSIKKLEKPQIGFQDNRPPVTGAKSTTQSSLFRSPQEAKTLKSQTTKPFPGDLTPSVFDFTTPQTPSSKGFENSPLLSAKKPLKETLSTNLDFVTKKPRVRLPQTAEIYEQGGEKPKVPPPDQPSLFSKIFIPDNSHQ
ncbi:uncharacterized protein BO88DRAFT_470972 [Aspergillus vadensis CBS 113365]|uniref:Uncharacterized protein n=1 Tax=Aspergillus vadensis (strain CBS 113365 / IMI 142717 / IBT 24658) TaxID=1448311 RepID=A0A319B682_ASPVC|nr:hypothetical protein BO88DRAFT_470972 [Aspergillus vadensis CBS 113365]PYH65780.1 hypothetical protein BO88DRAFT_470972 [Aspergillus vadensis CBS 113365]